MDQIFDPAKAREKKKIVNAKQINLRDFSDILVIVPESVEDFILCAPAITALKEAMPPEGKITAVVNSECMGFVRGLKSIDRAICLDRANPVTAIKTSFSLMRTNFQLVINFNPHLFPAVLAAVFTKARAKIAFADGKEKSFYNSLHNLLLHSLDQKQHKIIKYLNLTRFVGANTYDFTPKLSIPDEDRDYAKKFLEKNNISATDNLVGIHPASHDKKKRWAMSKFQQLTSNLIDKYNCKVLVFSNRGEHDRVNEYMVVTKKKAIQVDTHDYLKMAAISRFLCCFVTNESDLMHIFAPFTNIVAIWGPTDPEENKPSGPNNEILLPSDGNADSVPVSRVTEAVKAYISSGN
jgi:ADP-heptose:LPS heptosyltransferase